MQILAIIILAIVGIGILLLISKPLIKLALWLAEKALGLVLGVAFIAVIILPAYLLERWLVSIVAVAAGINDETENIIFLSGLVVTAIALTAFISIIVYKKFLRNKEG